MVRKHGTVGCVSAIAAYLELEAYRRGRAVAASSTRWHADLDDERLGAPVIFCGYAIANEHVGLHAFLLDRPGSSAPVEVVRADDLDLARAAWAGGSPVFVVAFDGRSPAGRSMSLNALSLLLGDELEGDVPPRLFLPSRADWALLREVLCWELDRLPRLNVGAAEDGSRREERGAISSLLLGAHYFVERAGSPGTQALTVLADALGEAFVVPSPVGSHPHLGAALSWLVEEDRDPEMAYEEALAAEQLPAGPRSRPEFDNAVLLPALEELNRLRRAGEPFEEQWQAAAEALFVHVGGRRELAQRAIAAIWSSPAHRRAASTEDLVELEVGAWGDHRTRVARVREALTAFTDLADAEDCEGSARATAETAAARDAVRSRRRSLLPTRAWRSRFGEWEARSQALELRRLVEDVVARAEARVRGATLAGEVDAVAVVSDPAVALGDTVNARGETMTRWSTTFRATLVLRVDDDVPLGRFRRGAEVLLGPDRACPPCDVPGLTWVFVEANHAHRLVTLQSERRATKSAPAAAGAPHLSRFKVPAAFEMLPRRGARAEVLPISGVARLALDVPPRPSGPAPATHLGGVGAGRKLTLEPVTLRRARARPADL